MVKKSNWLEGEDNLLRVLSGSAIDDILKFFPERTESSVINRIVRLNLDYYNNRKEYPKQLEPIALSVYRTSDESIESISSYLNVGSGYISSVLRKYNINPPKKEKKIRVRRNVINYKDKLPNNELQLGYICGLIATDGSLSKTKKDNISIGFSDQDCDTLRSIMDLVIEPQPRLITRKDCDWKMFSAKLPKLTSLCESIGITSVKTYTLDVNIDDKSDEFKLGFIRGVIDGDGYVTDVHKYRSQCYIRVTTSSIKFADFLKSFAGLNPSVWDAKKHYLQSHYCVTWSGPKCIQLIKILPEIDIAMTRKTKKMYDIIDRHGDKPI